MAAQQMGDFMTASTAVIARSGDLALAGPLGSLDAYLDRVGRIPVLTRDEERDLAEKLRSQGDLGAARQLVLSHLRFVVHIARGDRKSTRLNSSHRSLSRMPSSA